MHVRTVGASTPITDAVYGRKGARRAKKSAPARRDARHAFSVGANLPPETFTALETLKEYLAQRGGRR